MSNLSNKIVILGTGSVKGSTIPTSIQVWESKFDREIGDKITFEKVVWTVISVGFPSKRDAIDTMNGMSALYVKKGYWSGSKAVTAKF